MNYWHEVDPGNKEVMNVIIEIPAGSKNKYEIDKATGLIALDRAMHTAQDYPFDYGFVPKTIWDDGDALDVVVLSTYPLYPGILVRVRPVGIMKMIDEGESDDKVIGVPVDDPRWEDITQLNHINSHKLREIRHFFMTYKSLSDKVVEIDGFENEEAAKSAFERSRKMYDDKFKS